MRRSPVPGAWRRILADREALVKPGMISSTVKDALSHYWGGPKLTESPLLNLQVVQRSMAEHDNNPVNALRAILRQAINRVRPEGDRRFTGEWILYNILELKFIRQESPGRRHAVGGIGSRFI